MGTRFLKIVLILWWQKIRVTISAILGRAQTSQKAKLASCLFQCAKIKQIQDVIPWVAVIEPWRERTKCEILKRRRCAAPLTVETENDHAWRAVMFDKQIVELLLFMSRSTIHGEVCKSCGKQPV